MLAPRVALSLVPALTFGPAAAAAPRPSQPSGVEELLVPGHAARARVWTSVDADGRAVELYAVSEDGRRFGEPRRTRHRLALLVGTFDPLLGEPPLPAELRAAPGAPEAIVQYRTQGLEAYREVLRAHGARVLEHLPWQADVVELVPAARATVAGLDFVRAVVPFHPAYKLEPALLAAVAANGTQPVCVNVLVRERGGQAPVVAWIEDQGGRVEHVAAPTDLLTATLGVDRLPALAALPHVRWIDRWSAPEPDMDIARLVHGAVQAQTALGATGQGVHVEVLDGGCSVTHPDLQNFIFHTENTPSAHGTATSGIVAASGLENAKATGVLPQGLLVIADYKEPFAGGSRYAHSAELVDPELPYRCVLQSNSWGSPRTTLYTSVSAQLDLILFDLEHLSILHSQGNSGNPTSRPEAWAKNVISVGGINHLNTATLNDDFWAGASGGPAADGRIKPDVASFYDAIFTIDQPGAAGFTPGNYFDAFGGVSAATAISAGHLGLFYQLWHEGLFGNTPTGATVFDDAPKNSTAKAVLVNTATQWPFSGVNHNLTRVHQGWGHPDVGTMIDRANRMLVIDETDVLGNLDSTSYALEVAPGEPELHATLVYRDLPGNPGATVHRVNDLDLVVVDPDGTTYRGNWGLTAGNTSIPGGEPNPLDTVENVIVAAPLAGTWTVTVLARELNADAHLETPGLDADYALVVSGVTPSPSGPPAAPTGLEGAGRPGRVRLRFVDRSSDETGFEIERAPDETSFVLIHTTGPGQTTFEDVGVLPDRTYHYRVRAVNALGASAYTPSLLVRTTREHGPAQPSSSP